MTCPFTWLRKPRATYPPNFPKSLRALGAHLCQIDLISNTCSSIHLPSHHFPLHLHPRPRSSPPPQTCSTFNAPTSSLNMAPWLHSHPLFRLSGSQRNNPASSANVRHEPTGPAVGRHTSRAAAGERPRKAPEALDLFLPIELCQGYAAFCYLKPAAYFSGGYCNIMFILTN